MADNTVENLETNRESKTRLAQSSKRNWARMKQDNQYNRGNTATTSTAGKGKPVSVINFFSSSI